MKKLLRLIALATVSVLVFTSCEGPMGPQGQQGPVGPQGPIGGQGEPGSHAECMPCHKPASVAAVYRDYDEFSMHSITTIRSGGSCATCHTQQGFLYAVENETYSIPTGAIGRFNKTFSCETCHSSIHTEYDWRLTSTAPVSLVMWGGEKTVNLTFDNSSSNLCVRCHQPRAIANISQLISDPAATYDLGTPTYTTGVHYNTGQGVLATGGGGIEFGSGYENSVHVATTSCATCHMPENSELPGYMGHKFSIKDNFDGCNASCHGGRMSETSSRLISAKAEVEQLIEDLANKLKEQVGSGIDIVTPNGYLDIYNATSNPTGYWGASGNPAFPAVTNAQYGAIINYQLVARDAGARAASHNHPYVKTLLENSIAALD